MSVSITNPEREAPEGTVAVERQPQVVGGFDPDLVSEFERLSGLRREELFRGIAPDVANTILGPRTAISPEREFEIRQDLIETMEGLAETSQKRGQVSTEAWYKLKIQAMKSASQIEAAGVSARGRTQAAKISGLYRQAYGDGQALERAYSSLNNNVTAGTLNEASKGVTALTANQGGRSGRSLLMQPTQKNNFTQAAHQFFMSEEGQNPLARQGYLLRVSDHTGVPITDLVAAITTSPTTRGNRTAILGADGKALENLLSPTVPLGTINDLQNSINQHVTDAQALSAGSRGGNAAAAGLLSAVGSPVPGEVPLEALKTLGITAEMAQNPEAAKLMEELAKDKVEELFADLAKATERSPYIQGQIDSIMATAAIEGSPMREYALENGLNPDNPSDLQAAFELLEEEYADVQEYETGQAKLRAQVARERQKAELQKRREYEAGMGPERMAAKQVVQGIDLEELPEGEEGAAPPQRVGMGLREDQMNNMRVIEDRLRAAADQAEKAGDTDRARYLRQEADRYLQLQSSVTDIQMGLPSRPDPMTIDAAQKASDESAVPETFGAAGGEAGIETQEVSGVPKRVGDSEYYVMPNQGGELFRLQDGKFVKAPPPTERRPDDFATDYEDLDMETSSPAPGTPEVEAAPEVSEATEDVAAETASLNAAGATSVSPKVSGDDYSPYATFSDGSFGFIDPKTGRLTKVRAGTPAHTSIGEAIGSPSQPEGSSGFQSGDLVERAKRDRARRAEEKRRKQIEEALPVVEAKLRRALTGISDPAQAMEIINAYTGSQRGSEMLEMFPEDLKRTIEEFKTAAPTSTTPAQPSVGNALQTGLADSVNAKISPDPVLQAMDQQDLANEQEDEEGDYTPPADDDEGE